MFYNETVNVSVVRGNTVVQIPSPEVKFKGGKIKWYEDKVRVIPANKEIKMKPIKTSYGDYSCPRCKCNGIIAPYYALSKEMVSNYCNRCGQVLDWGDISCH